MCVCKCTLTSVCASAFPTLQLKTKTFEFPWPSPGLPSESGNVDESFPLPPCTQSDSMALHCRRMCRTENNERFHSAKMSSVYLSSRQLEGHSVG